MRKAGEFDYKSPRRIIEERSQVISPKIISGEDVMMGDDTTEEITRARVNVHHSPDNGVRDVNDIQIEGLEPIVMHSQG